MKFTSCLKINLILFVVALAPATVWCQEKPAAFEIVPLGVKGGSDESNLSSYALAIKGTNQYVCLDAGTLNFGVQRAIAHHVWKGDAGEVIKNNFKGYLISHPHLDHVSGLIINSPDDSGKIIYGSSYCLEVIKQNYFSWKSWANFGNEGETPALGKYHYTVLIPGNEVPLENTGMSVKSFTLSHSTTSQSTAFLVREKENFILYLGDTGADEIEKSTRLQSLWKEVGPLIRDKKLKAIFIEVSFSNEQPDQQLFGHLTPRLLMNELNVLSQSAGGKDALINFPIVITHMKPSGDREKIIKEQLADLNNLKLKLIFPQQGKRLEF